MLLLKLWRQQAGKLRNRSKRQSTVTGMAIVALLILIGMYLLRASHAATPFVSLEPENGVLSGSAVTINDTTASGSRSLRFAAIGATVGRLCRYRAAYSQ